MLVKNIFHRFLDLTFPVECFGCEVLGSYLCSECLSKIKINLDSRCLGCYKETLLGQICRVCQPEFALNRVLVATNYDQEIVHQLIWNLKYNFIDQVSISLALIIQKYLQINKYIDILKLNKETIVPVPLHQSKLSFREFNQSEKIANAFNELHPDWQTQKLLIRKRPTRSQLGLTKQERKMNLQNSFEFVGREVPKRIILLDDVVTTGSTLNEAALVLKRAGVSEVWGLVVAKRDL